MKHLASLALLVATCALPYTAQAQGPLAYTAINVNLRAGPASDYPIVAVLPAGYAVAVQGCLPAYTWCDVIAGPVRGWLYAGNINYFYQNTYVPVLEYGPLIGIGVLAFVLNDYWGSFYPDRPFYRDRQRWQRHRPPPDRALVPRHSAPAPQRPGLIGPRERPEQIGPRQRPGQIGPRPPPPRSSFPGSTAPRPPNSGFSPRAAPGVVQPGTVRPPPPQLQARPGATPQVDRPSPGGAAQPRGQFQRGERGERVARGTRGTRRTRARQAAVAGAA